MTTAGPSTAPPVAPPGGPARTAIGPGLALLAGLAAISTALGAVIPVLSPLVVGVVLGALVVNVTTLPDRYQPGITFGARSLLRVGVALMGFRLSAGDVIGLGAGGLLVVAMVVVVTFLGTRWLARRLGVPADLGLLVATGYSICGASAIAAMDGVVRAKEEETAYAITLVTLCGTLSIFLLPLLADPLGIAGEAFGTWVGGAVHDVGQVVATASTADPDAVASATVVKLTRVILLAPLVAVVAVGRRRSTPVSDGGGAATTTPPVLPLFVVGFLAAIAIRSTGWLSGTALDHIATVEKLLLTVALAGLGAGVQLARMRALSGRPLLLGLLAWVLVAGAAAVGTALVA